MSGSGTASPRLDGGAPSSADVAAGRAGNLPSADRAAQAAGRAEPAADLRWVVHPAAGQPTLALLLLATIGVAALFSARVSGSPAVGVLAALLLLFSLRAWFLPRTYVLDDQGAAETGPLCATRQLAWSQVRQVLPSRFGLYLSTRHHDSRLLADRGIFLRTAGNARSVAAFIAGVRQPS